MHGDGLAVPSDRPLDDLTAELTRMLGDPDPALRDGTAYPTLTTWLDRGVYDDLLAGLGDGMAMGLLAGLGEQDTDTVFRRSFSALVLGECIARDNRRPLLPGGKILEWGDRLATWLLRERDLRGYVPGKGWAHAIAHGADALAILASSPHLATPELTVLLDVAPSDPARGPAKLPPPSTRAAVLRFAWPNKDAPVPGLLQVLEKAAAAAKQGSATSLKNLAEAARDFAQQPGRGLLFDGNLEQKEMASLARLVIAIGPPAGER